MFPTTRGLCSPEPRDSLGISPEGVTLLRQSCVGGGVGLRPSCAITG